MPVPLSRAILRCLGLLAAAVLAVGCARSDFEGYRFRPYRIRGIVYTPMPPAIAPGYIESGVASHYREGWAVFPGKTALGERLWPWTRAAAHRTLPLPCRVRVTNLRNGRQTTVRISDRGPFIPGRSLDVTEPVARELGFFESGLAPVQIEVLSVGDGRWMLRQPTIPRAIEVPSGHP